MSTEPMTGDRAIAIVVDAARGLVRHDYRGDCPDGINGPHARDTSCELCRAIDIASRLRSGAEPIAPFRWWRQRGPDITDEYFTEHSDDEERPIGDGWQPLYTSPPPRAEVDEAMAQRVLSLYVEQIIPHDNDAPPELRVEAMRHALAVALSNPTYQSPTDYERIGSSEATRRDAERYRWLRSKCVRKWVSDMPEDRGSPSLDLDFSADGHDLDAAIDAALSKPAAEGGD